MEGDGAYCDGVYWLAFGSLGGLAGASVEDSVFLIFVINHFVAFRRTPQTLWLLDV